MIIALVLALSASPKVTQVTGADFISILTSDGSVYGIGQDPYGMHLRPDWKDAVIVVPTKMTLPVPVVQVASGERSCYALTKDGTVLAWGQNDSGQLGDGKPYGGYTPRLSAEPVVDLKDIIQISAHGRHAVALRKDGQVFFWGTGVRPLGKPDTNSTPILINGLNNIVKVDTGSGHTLALSKDGTVYAWGSNNNGQIGNGKNAESIINPIKVSGLPKIIDISAGMEESSALSSDGKVYVWGLNTSGLLGNGKKPGSANEPGGMVLIPTLVKGLSSVQSISIDYGSQVALHTNGTLTVWGFNGRGQHGTGESGGYTLTPRKPSISGVASINAIGNRTFVIKRDGTLWWSGVSSRTNRGPLKSNVRVFTKLSLETN